MNELIEYSPLIGIVIIVIMVIQDELKIKNRKWGENHKR